MKIFTEIHGVHSLSQSVSHKEFYSFSQICADFVKSSFICSIHYCYSLKKQLLSLSHTCDDVTEQNIITWVPLLC